MFKKKNSIVKKVGLTIFLFVFIIFILYYNFLNVQIKTHLEQTGKDQLEKESEYLSAEIELFMQKYILIVEQAKNNADFIKIAKEINNRNAKQNNASYSEVINQLNDICSLDENIEQLYIALESSDDLISNTNDYDLEPDYDLSNRDWYINTINQDKTTITKPYVDVITNKIVITIATPLKDNDTLLGAVGLDILIEDFNSIMKEYNNGFDGDMGIVYNTGLILYHPKQHNKNNLNKEVYIQNLLDQKIAEAVISGEKGFTQYNYKGKEKYIAYFPVKGTNIVVFTSVLSSKIFAPINRFILINLLILFLVTIIIITFLFFLERLISTPLKTMCKEIENYENNGLINLPKEYLKRKDEIGILSNGITFMLNRISNYILKLEEINEELFYTKEMINMDRVLFKTTLRSLGDGVISTDGNGNIRVMNDVAETLTGWKRKEAVGKPFEEVFQIINEHTRKKLQSPVEMVYKNGKMNELDENAILIQKNGQELPIEDSAAPILDNEGNITGVVIVFRDFTDKKNKQQKISYLSYHDQLTGLYNRHFFEKALIDLDNDQNLPLSVVMLDVNGLKLTNDAFGHQVGDKLLQMIADGIKKVSRKGDVASRIGGDEFVLLLPKTNYVETELIINNICRELEKKFIENIVISISTGWETKTSSNQSIMEIYSKSEENMYRDKLIESQNMRKKTIEVIINTLHESGNNEKIHAENVSKLCKKIGEILNFDSELLQDLETASLLHDIGKIAVSNTTLEKEDKLTTAEYQMVKRHSEVGYHILKSVDKYSNLSDYVLAHHERWDGTGYPRGLKGDEIPLISRIIAVADAYEAMISDRPYRPAMDKEDALAELVKCSGTQFDPNIVQVFVNLVKNNPLF